MGPAPPEDHPLQRTSISTHQHYVTASRADEPLWEGSSRALTKALCTSCKQLVSVLWHKRLAPHKARSEDPEHSQCHAVDMSVTHHGERVEEVVESPGNDDNVVDVQPEGENHSCQSHSCRERRRAASVQVSSSQLSSQAPQPVSWQSQKKRISSSTQRVPQLHRELVSKGGSLPRTSHPPVSTG